MLFLFFQRQAQFTCTVIFVLWGVLVHLVLPPFVFMSQEGWTYIEGLYFSFVTLTTIGFGDLVAGKMRNLKKKKFYPINYNLSIPELQILTTLLAVLPGVEPNKEYPTLYRYFVEVWIYLGLAWLSLFFNWKVRMVIEAHKALKKRRKLRKRSLDELQYYKECNKADLCLPPSSNDSNIFSFLSKKQEGYSDLIKQIGTKKEERRNRDGVNSIKKSEEIRHSKSCSDAHMFNTILSLDRSPRQKRCYSFSDRVTVALSKSKNYLLGSDDCLMLKEQPLEDEIELDHDEMYENQLDKVDIENDRVGNCRAGGQQTQNSKDYHPLMFHNANITFVDEENFLCNNLEDDDDSKAKLSITTCDKNIETNTREERSTKSESSVFASDDSVHSHSYEKIVEEYAKEESRDS